VGLSRKQLAFLFANGIIGEETHGHYNHVLYYKSDDPLAVLDSGEIRSSSVYTGVSLTSHAGLKSHGPFELKFVNPGSLVLKPALYGTFEYDETSKSFRKPVKSVTDQFGNKYSLAEWEAIPNGKPTRDSPVFRQKEMFADEREWSSLGNVPIANAHVTVHTDQPGWRTQLRRNKKIVEELKKRGLLVE